MNDIISIGDPLIVNNSGKQNVSIITQILHGQNETSYIRQVDMQNIAIKLQVRNLEMVEVEKLLFWSGKYSSPVFAVSGKDCLSIEPQISAKPPEGCSSYFFDKQLIQAIGVHIVLSQNNVDTQENTKCKICKKKVNLEDMRVHVGTHIIKRDITENLHDICGFCGKHGCHISLEETSHKGKRSSFHQKVNVSTSSHIRNWGMSLLEKILALIRFPTAKSVTCVSGHITWCITTGYAIKRMYVM